MLLHDAEQPGMVHAETMQLFTEERMACGLQQPSTLQASTAQCLLLHQCS
jgi:hypothetical protein